MIFILKIKLACLFPVFLNKAASINDPLERLKIVATSCLASFFYTNTFLKPVKIYIHIIYIEKLILIYNINFIIFIYT